MPNELFKNIIDYTYSHYHAKVIGILMTDCIDSPVPCKDAVVWVLPETNEPVKNSKYSVDNVKCTMADVRFAPDYLKSQKMLFLDTLTTDDKYFINSNWYKLLTDPLWLSYDPYKAFCDVFDAVMDYSDGSVATYFNEKKNLLHWLF